VRVGKRSVNSRPFLPVNAVLELYAAERGPIVSCSPESIALGRTGNASDEVDGPYRLLAREMSVMQPGRWLGLLALLLCGEIAVSEELPQLRAILPTDSILIVSPHPDDESLCCGGLIHTARRAGARVTIVWVTYGDGFKWSAVFADRTLRPRAGAYRDLALLRDGEAREAAALLQVDPGSLFFLGYPDRGVLALLFDHYYPDTPWRSKFTGSNTVVYEDAVDPGAEYDGEDLERDFRTVLDRVKPTLVLAPSPQDTHPDHRGTGILAWRAMSARQALENIRFWIVHGGHGWPHPRAHRPDLPQTIPPRGVGMQWEQFPLDEDARNAKQQAVRAHRTQLKVMGRVMESYVRSIELYSRTPAPPHSLCALPEPCEFEEGSLIEKSGL
jgi:LmbE family N-acetylglucosaminyl deacetylase